MNRSIDRTFTFLDRKIRERRKLKSSEVKKKFISKRKTSGQFISDLNGNIKISDRKLNLRNFVMGSKDAPRPQVKGRTNAQRRRSKLNFQVVPGRKFQLTRAFLARGRGGNTLVFRRSKTKKGRNGKAAIIPQFRPSLAKLFRGSANFREPILNFAKKIYATELERQINVISQGFRFGSPRRRKSL